MKILFVSSECAPFSKSGGLADVAFSLPPALQKTGDDMAIVTPMYRVTQENYGDEFERIKTCQIALGQRRLACSLYRGALNGVTVYAIGNEHCSIARACTAMATIRCASRSSAARSSICCRNSATCRIFCTATTGKPRWRSCI